MGVIKISIYLDCQGKVILPLEHDKHIECMISEMTDIIYDITKRHTISSFKATSYIKYITLKSINMVNILNTVKIINDDVNIENVLEYIKHSILEHELTEFGTAIDKSSINKIPYTYRYIKLVNIIDKLFINACIKYANSNIVFRWNDISGTNYTIANIKSLTKSFNGVINSESGIECTFSQLSECYISIPFYNNSVLELSNKILRTINRTNTHSIVYINTSSMTNFNIYLDNKLYDRYIELHNLSDDDLAKILDYIYDMQTSDLPVFKVTDNSTGKTILILVFNSKSEYEKIYTIYNSELAEEIKNRLIINYLSSIHGGDKSE